MRTRSDRKAALLVLLAAAVGLVVPAGRARAQQITDADVQKAIEKGKAYLIGQQSGDGSFGGTAGNYGYGASVLAFMTLAYMGEHPNRDVMSKGLAHVLSLNPDTAFGERAGYATPIHTMGLAYISTKLLGEKRAEARAKMMENVLRFQLGQNPNGGWRYKLSPTEGWDFSVTQWPILAMRDASLVGIEIPEGPLRKAWGLYKSKQNDDGGWSYQDGASRGSMTAAGLASVFILSDLLEPASGCPCSSGRSQPGSMDTERRIDDALGWLSRNFDATKNPGHGSHNLYWLYCVERVGIAAGYKYFGDHNWYKEGARHLLRLQRDGGSWGSMVDSCFALLFLYKGRAPVLFNKLRFDGAWNMHRRDIANLTQFTERTKEQMFHWQIVELKAPVEELHDAPVLYISAESVPKWTDEEKTKLRTFTDTGGTILLEASCGNAGVRRWFKDFAKELWPEWPLRDLPKGHGLWDCFYDLKERPEIQGINDGVRECVLFCPDDISCPWHMKAYATKAYLFSWGINLYTYATDGAPLRAKLTDRGVALSGKYSAPVQSGPQRLVRIARLKHSGNWEVGVNYETFADLSNRLKESLGVTFDMLEVADAARQAGEAAPLEDTSDFGFDETDESGEEDTAAADAGTGPTSLADLGVAAADLAGHQVAYLAGSRAFALAAAEREALKAYLAGGGFLWAEAAGGSLAFDQSMRQLAGEMGWSMTLLPKTHGLMTGRLDPAKGYNLTSKVKFRRSLRVQRLGREYAELLGLFQGDRLVGVYSPYDVMFSLKGYEAHDCRGYVAEDALAVATNLALYLTTLPAP